MGHLPHILVPVLLAMHSWQSCNFLPQWKNCRSGTLLITIYIWQKGIEAEAASLKFDKALVGFLVDPIKNAHVCTNLCYCRLSDNKQGRGRDMWARLMGRMVLWSMRCVHQRGILADDPWDRKGPGRSPGFTYRGVLSGHSSSAVSPNH